VYAVNDPDFKAGVASLAQLLQIPPHADHHIVLKVWSCVLSHHTVMMSRILVWKSRYFSSNWATWMG